MYIRCSARDKMSFEEFLSDIDQLTEIIEVAFGGEEKNVETEQKK